MHFADREPKRYKPEGIIPIFKNYFSICFGLEEEGQLVAQLKEDGYPKCIKGNVVFTICASRIFALLLLILFGTC